MAIDRTREFRELAAVAAASSAAASAVASPAAAAAAAAGAPAASGSRAPSEFTLQTRAVGDRLNDARIQLGELQQLVECRGIGAGQLLEDRSVEIQAQANALRHALVLSAQELDRVERDFLQDDGVAGTGVGAAAEAGRRHRAAVVQTLRTRLADLTRDLKRALEQRTVALRRTAARRERLGAGTARFMRPEELAATAADDPEGPGPDLEAGAGSHLLLTAAERQAQPIYQTARAEAVESMQRFIAELGQVFSRVAQLVATQEELAVRIEDDVSGALHHVQRGEVHLIKYLSRVSSNRYLILKVRSKT